MDSRDNSNMIVAVRVRPDNEKEKHSFKSKTVVRVLDERVVIFDPAVPGGEHLPGVPDHYTRSRDQRYVFDRVFDQYASQEEVYEHTAKLLLESVLNGFNATVFAYGATGSGKTHTMIGEEESPGIMVQAMRDLFRAIEQNEDKQYNVSMTYLEVYNETIRDLLIQNSPPLALRATAKGDVVQGLSEHHPQSAQEVMDVLRMGNFNRSVSPTAANEVSSRSHAVMQVIVQQRDRTADVKAAVNVAKLSLVDLAGSERACHTENRGNRMKEGANINRSLLALGNCINALCEGGKARYIPYRNSKLTRLLKDSLGGNCKTVMVATVSPSSLCYEDSLNTLKYANRAKNIRLELKKNVVNVQFHVHQYKQIVSQLREEVTRLKEKLMQQEKEKEALLAEASKANSLADGKEEESMQQFLKRISANFEERSNLKRSIMELEEQEQLDILKCDKKKQSVNMWDSNPNRGATGVYTPPQIAKMRDEIRVVDHNLQENAVKKKNLQKRLERNLDAFHNLQADAAKKISSRHRKYMLEKEEQTQVLRLEKTQLLNACLLKDQKISFQAQQLAELEQLLREQYILLKTNGLVSEGHAKKYTTTTGDIVLTPRRSNSLPCSKSPLSERPTLSNRRHSPSPLAFELPVLSVSSFSSPRGKLKMATIDPLPPLELDEEIEDQHHHTVDHAAMEADSPFTSPPQVQRPASILKKRKMTDHRTENPKRVTIISPNSQEPQQPTQPRPRKRAFQKGTSKDFQVEIRTPDMKYTKELEGLAQTIAGEKVCRPGLMAPTVASRNRAKERNQERRRSSPLQNATAGGAAAQKRFSAVYVADPRRQSRGGKENALPTPSSFLKSGAIRGSAKKPAQRLRTVPSWHVTKG